MKILYIAQERCAAQVAARALARIAPNVRLSWASSPGAALGWIRDNRDAHAVIAEAGREDPAFDALLEQVRSLGVTAPIAAIAPEHLEALSTALEANLATLTNRDRKRSEVLAAQLREIEDLRRQEQQRLAESQTQQDAALARTTRICTALQEQLMELEAALHRADERHAAQTTATEQLARREAELSAAVAEAMAVRATVERRLAEAEAAHQLARQTATEQLAAAGERHAVAEDQLARETALRTALEERLALAEHARQAESQTHAAELVSLTAQLGDREARHEASLTRINRICTGLQQRLMELEAALRSGEERQVADAASIERLRVSERELGSALAEAIAARSTLAQALSEKDAAHQRGAADLTLARQRCSAFEEQVTREAAARAILEERLAAAERARLDADQQHATVLTSLTTRLTEAEAQHAAGALQNAALDRQLLESGAALEDARREWRSEVSELASRFQQRETELGAALAAAADQTAAVEGRLREESGARSSLEERLAAADRARADADQQHANVLASLTTRLADTEAQYGAVVSQNATLDRHLLDRGAELDNARREWRSEVAALAERLEQRESEWGGSLAEALAARTAVEGRLAETQAAHDAAQHRSAAALADALAARALVENRLSDVEAVLDQSQQRSAAALAEAADEKAAIEARLGAEISTRAAVEERLAAAERARHDADQQHATERTSLTTRLADVEAQYVAAVSQNAALDRQLLDRGAELENARREWSIEVAALAERLQQREAELGASLADALAARTAVEGRLTDAEAAQHESQQRSIAALAEAADQAAAMEARLSEQSSARANLEERLAAADRARQHAAHEHAAELASLTTRLADVEAQYTAAVSQNAALDRQLLERGAELEHARRDWQSEVAALADRLQQRETELGASLAAALAARAAVEGRLIDAEATHEDAQRRLAAALAESETSRAVVESRLAEAEAAHQDTQQRSVAALAAAESARGDTDRQLVSVSSRLTDLQAQHEAALRHSTLVQQDLTMAVAALEQSRRDWQAEVSTAASRHADLESQLEAGGIDLARLRDETEGLRRQLEVMRRRADSLRRHAAQVPMLQVHLDRSHKENRRQFERAPYGLAECSRDGAITRVNHSLAGLLGYRSAADLRAVDVVEAAFESPADLRWLIDRALSSGKAESLETTLRTQDHRRISVRLHAHSQDDSVAIAVEDLTALHEVEQRLREAHRLEAVGRVASEVAVTCDTLLRDVSQGGRQWLDALESDTRFRQQGELLFGDVTRAAGFLRQFVAYGHQQISNVASVNLPRALRDMAPILKRVLGDDIALLLPKTTGHLDVDVDAERVERILVNVANYARARMPHGGRVRIQLATAIVDGQFVASHPKVRPGAHVLLTIEEIQGPVWPALPIGLPAGRVADPGPQSPSDRPGIDLGPLVTLIGEVGGHLWMSAEPAGNMTLQIHLPRRTEDESLQPVAAAAGRARHFTRWFRH